MKISCVIPAYNESKGIAAVLSAVTGAAHPLHEIIVVDDASSDGTKEVVAGFPSVRLLVNERNQGKSRSVARGISESTGDFVLLLDADLLGILACNIDALLEPILSNRADVVISMRANTPGWMKRLGVDFMSGERVLPRTLLMESLDEIAQLRSFGLEVFLNRHIVRHRCRVESVLMENVKNHMKWYKRGFWSGIRHEILLWRDLLRTVSLWECVRQNFAMKKLLVHS
jgi:glycosyltransferase involved in cell wall biosynthesis